MSVEVCCVCEMIKSALAPPSPYAHSSVRGISQCNALNEYMGMVVCCVREIFYLSMQSSLASPTRTYHTECVFVFVCFCVFMCVRARYLLRGRCRAQAAPACARVRLSTCFSLALFCTRVCTCLCMSHKISLRLRILYVHGETCPYVIT